MKISEAISIKETTLPQINRITTIIQTLEQSKRQLNTELEQLEGNFPARLAAFHVGTLTALELNETRNRIKTIHEELSEIPRAIPALRELLQPLSERLRTAMATIAVHEQHEKYESFRNMIIDKGTISDNEASELRLIAAHAGFSNEAENLLQALERHRYNKTVDPEAVFTFKAV